MSTILHLSVRVKDPQRSADLYAELLGGAVVSAGPALAPAGVKTIRFGGKRGPLADIVEF